MDDNKLEETEYYKSSKPSKRTGYTEQNHRNPKLIDTACRFCIEFIEITSSKEVSWSSEKGNKGKKTQTREFETTRPYCEKHKSYVDEFFGTCPKFDKAVTA